MFLPKPIGDDVTDVTVSDSLSWIRKEGAHITLTNAHVSVAVFSQNMVEVAISCDGLSALTYYTAVLRAPVTFTFG